MRVVYFVLFLLYFFVLLQLTVFKSEFFFAFVPAGSFYKAHTQTATFYQYNLVPFRTIRSFLFGNAPLLVKCTNLLGNVLLFVPFGWLVPMVLKVPKSRGRVLLAAFFTSVSFELYQYFTHTGNGDVDDVILNTIGGFVGYQLFKRWFKASLKKHRMGVGSNQSPTKRG